MMQAWTPPQMQRSPWYLNGAAPLNMVPPQYCNNVFEVDSDQCVGQYSKVASDQCVGQYFQVPTNIVQNKKVS